MSAIAVRYDPTTGYVLEPAAIKFPNAGIAIGAATPGSITGVAGAITVAAAGTNQNLNLVASGSGLVLVTSNGVTGTAAILGANTFTGLQTFSAEGAVLHRAGASTATSYAQFSNTGGDAYFGVNGSSVGGFLAGSTAYATTVCSVGATDLQLGSNGIVRQTILANGNVGIGTTSPTLAKLQVEVTSGAQIGGAYDASNYWTATTGATGLTTFDAVGSGAAFTFADNVGITSAGLSTLTVTATNGNGLSSVDFFTGNGGGALRWGVGANISAVDQEFFIKDFTGGTGSAITIAKTTQVVSLPQTTASTSPTTGALTVAGGLGVAGAGYFGGIVKTQTGTLASLGAAGEAGRRAFITDGSTTLILGLGLTAVGGSSNKVPVYDDGTNWIVG